MASLSTYTSDLQTLLNDPLAQFYTSANLIIWVNRARVTTAKATGCVRLITPSSATVTALAPANLGSGYVAATVTLSGPDAIGPGFVTATATATIVGGQITAYTVTNAGSGYVAPPTVTITSATGTGASATPTLGPHMTTTLNQEVYTFAALTTALQAANPGVQAVVGVANVSVSWGALRPSLDWTPWASFQAYLRAFNQGASQPRIWAQLGRDENGAIYLFPVPASTTEMQVECYCTPAGLSNTQAVDLIPDNLYQAVVYKAAQFAYESAQRRDDANAMKESWKAELTDAASYAYPGRTPSFYADE